MKVKDLVERLNKFDPELKVLCSTEDSELLAPKHLFRLLDIHDVSVVEAELTRGEADQVPSLKIGHTSLSQKHVIIEVISDF